MNTYTSLANTLSSEILQRAPTFMRKILRPLEPLYPEEFPSIQGSNIHKIHQKHPYEETASFDLSNTESLSIAKKDAVFHVVPYSVVASSTEVSDLDFNVIGNTFNSEYCVPEWALSSYQADIGDIARERVMLPLLKYEDSQLYKGLTILAQKTGNVKHFREELSFDRVESIIKERTEKRIPTGNLLVSPETYSKLKDVSVSVVVDTNKIVPDNTVLFLLPPKDLGIAHFYHPLILKTRKDIGGIIISASETVGVEIKDVNGVFLATFEPKSQNNQTTNTGV